MSNHDQRLEDAARQLPSSLQEAGRWSIPIDEELMGRLEDANGTLERIKVATADAERQLSALKAGIDSSLEKSVSVASSGALLNEDLIAELADGMLRLDAVETIVEAFRAAMGRAEQTKVEAAARLSDATREATAHLNLERKERYEIFRAGRGERPVMMSKPTGLVRIRCQDCERLIGLVDTEMLYQSLFSAPIFKSLDGERNLFGSQSTPDHWKCPACGYGPFKDARWILTEFWTFIQVPDAIQGEVDGDLAVPETARMTPADSDHQEPEPGEPTVPAAQLARELRDDTIRRLRDQGKSEREIAAIIGLGKSTVHDILTRQPGTGASL